MGFARDVEQLLEHAEVMAPMHERKGKENYSVAVMITAEPVYDEYGDFETMAYTASYHMGGRKIIEAEPQDDMTAAAASLFRQVPAPY